MKRIEEFTLGSKNFVYFDFSGLSSDENILEVVESGKSILEKYPEQSVYSITNIASVRLDTRTKEIAIKFMEHNKPYVKYAFVIGIDGILKMTAQTVMNICGRSNVKFGFTKEHAIEWLLQKD